MWAPSKAKSAPHRVKLDSLSANKLIKHAHNSDGCCCEYGLFGVAAVSLAKQNVLSFVNARVWVCNLGQPRVGSSRGMVVVGREGGQVTHTQTPPPPWVTEVTNVESRDCEHRSPERT